MRQLSLLNYYDSEDNRREATRSEPPGEGHGGSTGVGSEHGDRHWKDADHREAEDGIGRDAPVDVRERGAEQDGAEDDEGAAVQEVADLLAEAAGLIRLAAD